MRHELVSIPAPQGGRVATIHWFLPSAHFDALVVAERAHVTDVSMDDGTTFRSTLIRRDGVRISVIEARGEQPWVTADVTVRAA